MTALEELRNELDYLRDQVRQTGPNLEKLRIIWERMWRTEVAIELRTRPWRTIFVFVVATDRDEAEALAEMTGWSTRGKARTHLKTVKTGLDKYQTRSPRYRIFKVRVRERRRSGH